MIKFHSSFGMPLLFHMISVVSSRAEITLRHKSTTAQFPHPGINIPPHEMFLEGLLPLTTPAHLTPGTWVVLEFLLGLSRAARCTLN